MADPNPVKFEVLANFQNENFILTGTATSLDDLSQQLKQKKSISSDIKIEYWSPDWGEYVILDGLDALEGKKVKLRLTELAPKPQPVPSPVATPPPKRVPVSVTLALQEGLHDPNGIALLASFGIPNNRPTPEASSPSGNRTRMSDSPSNNRTKTESATNRQKDTFFKLDESEKPKTPPPKLFNLGAALDKHIASEGSSVSLLDFLAEVEEKPRSNRSLNSSSQMGSGGGSSRKSRKDETDSPKQKRSKDKKPDAVAKVSSKGFLGKRKKGKKEFNLDDDDPLDWPNVQAVATPEFFSNDEDRPNAALSRGAPGTPTGPSSPAAGTTMSMFDLETTRSRSAFDPASYPLTNPHAVTHAPHSPSSPIGVRKMNIVTHPSEANQALSASGPSSWKSHSSASIEPRSLSLTSRRASRVPPKQPLPKPPPADQTTKNRFLEEKLFCNSIGDWNFDNKIHDPASVEIEDSGCRYLSDLMNGSKNTIVTLSLQNHNLTAIGIHSLHKALTQTPTLRKLVLSGNPLGDAGKQRLTISFYVVSCT